MSRLTDSRLRLLVTASTASLLTALLLLTAAWARADFTPVTLLSGTSRLQFEEASAPALAQGGDYVAFQGSLAGVSGVWRRNLRNGTVEEVAASYTAAAPGLGAPEAALSAPDAAAPSISADGRYVAFTTTADLEPEHTGANGPEGEPAADEGCPEVYVRDMDLPASAVGAYTLASALNSGQGIVYAACPAPSGNDFGNDIAGAQAAPGVALSADGRSVVFTVLSTSNLATGAEGPVSTPSSQVAVRDLETRTTTIVSATPEDEPVPGGGAFPSEASEQLGALKIASGEVGDEVTGSTAAISGDGSTVAWLGTNVPAQVPGSGPEIEAGIKHSQGEDAAAWEVEPLWRRIAAGPAAVTKRLLAGAGLDFYYTTDELVELVRGGSFVATNGQPVFIAPALSGDGQDVALIATAPPLTALPSLELYTHPEPQSDAYLVRVGTEADAEPRASALTETPNYDIQGTNGASGYVTDVAISPAGNRVAFDTQREQLALPTLTASGLPATQRITQTYVADLPLGTLTRATVTYDDAEPDGDAALLSISDDGTVAFASSATNLFYGDAIEASEVYLTGEARDEQQPAVEVVGPMPGEAPPSLEWRLSATAVAKSEGVVVVTVQAPGAGRIAVAARAQLPTAAASGRARQRRTGTASVGLVTRTVAEATTATRTDAIVRLRLRVGAHYRSYVTSRNGLYALLHVSFAAPGHATLTAQIPVDFHRELTRRAKAKAAPGKAAEHYVKKPADSTKQAKAARR